jgi:hypothetical protein
MASYDDPVRSLQLANNEKTVVRNIHIHQTCNETTLGTMLLPPSVVLVVNETCMNEIYRKKPVTQRSCLSLPILDHNVGEEGA